MTLELNALKEGAKGGEVKALQLLLNGKANAGLATDGSFGPATKAAVVAFQAASGLDQDGSVGPLTWSKLLKA